MKIMSPVLEKNSHEYAKILKSWDLRYNRDSKGAFLFEQFYFEFASQVVSLNYKNPNFAKYGRNFQFREKLRNIAALRVLGAFFHRFDDIVFDENAKIWGNSTRNSIVESSLNKIFSEISQVVTYGDSRIKIMCICVYNKEKRI